MFRNDQVTHGKSAGGNSSMKGTQDPVAHFGSLNCGKHLQNIMSECCWINWNSYCPNTSLKTGSNTKDQH